jgi:hypothetical protein
MPVDHEPARHALRACRAHVVLREDLEHRGAHHPHHDRQREDGDRDRRERELAEVGERIVEERRVDERRHPAEDAGREEQEQGRQPEAGDADPDQPRDARGIVARRVAADGGDHAERDADERGDEEGEDHQLERDRDGAPEDVAHGLRVAVRVAEVALDDAGGPVPVLLRVGPREAEVLAGLLLHLLGGGHVGPEEHVDDVARHQAHHQEDDDRDPDDGRDREQEAAGSESEHR